MRYVDSIMKRPERPRKKFLGKGIKTFFVSLFAFIFMLSNAAISLTAFEASVVNVTATIRDREPDPECAVCEKDDQGNIKVVVVDEDVVIDFNNLIPTYTGDPDLQPYFSFDKSGGSTADKWKAIFDLGGKKLLVKNGAKITVKNVPPTGNNQKAPGIEIKTTCEIEIEKGGSIEVLPLNQPAGDIVIESKGDIVINGSVRNVLSGTGGVPGNITIISECGDITTGSMSRVEIVGQDSGGKDITIAALLGDITINGLVDASYKGAVASRIVISAFKGFLTIDGRNSFGIEAGTRRPITSGVTVRSRRDPLPGQIDLFAKHDITVIGNRIIDRLHANYGAVAVKTASNSSKGGLIEARSLMGKIIATDRAFDNANRFNADAKINLFAFSDILLSVTSLINDGASTSTKAVVNNQAGRDGKGGVNTIRSHQAGITIGASSQVLANHGPNGSNGQNLFTSCTGVTNVGIVDPAAVITTDCNTIVINEFLPNPAGADNDPKPLGEWVELYNFGSSAIDVGSWFLYDSIDTHELDISALNTDTGDTIVPAGGFLVVYQDNDPDFALNNIGGDSVRLFDAAIGSGGKLQDSHTYTVSAPEGKSFARIPDGGVWFDPVPTPGESNEETTMENLLNAFKRSDGNEEVIEEDERDPVAEESASGEKEEETVSEEPSQEEFTRADEEKVEEEVVVLTEEIEPITATSTPAASIPNDTGGTEEEGAMGRETNEEEISEAETLNENGEEFIEEPLEEVTLEEEEKEGNEETSPEEKEAGEVIIEESDEALEEEPLVEEVEEEEKKNNNDEEGEIGEEPQVEEEGEEVIINEQGDSHDGDTGVVEEETQQKTEDEGESTQE